MRFARHHPPDEAVAALLGAFTSRNSRLRPSVDVFASRVAAAQRRMEVRIGQLLGPGRPGRRHNPGRDPGNELSEDQRKEFRAMAEDSDTVETES